MAVIPARGGSKGVPRKNVRLLNGKPLIAYSIEAGLASQYISHLIVSTDDPEIASISRSCGADVPFLRPSELATDEASSVDAALHSLNTIEEAKGIRYDVVVLLQPTSPLRTAEDIDNVLQLLFTSNAHSVVSFYQVEQGHPQYMYLIENNRPVPLLEKQTLNVRRQEFPKVYVRNGAIYAVRRDVLVSQRNFYGHDMRAYIMPFKRSINIDVEFDLALAEFLLQYQEIR